MMADKETPMLRLDVPKVESRLGAPKSDTLSAARAEVISRLWQAIAFIEETCTDLAKNVRQSGAKAAAIGAINMASAHLTVAAGVLVPRDLAHRARAARAEHIQGEKSAKRG